jgi:pilus assembly protein CpaE
VSYRVLLAFPDADVATQAAAVMQEDGDLMVAGSVKDGGEAMAALARGDVDALVVHEDLGPLPVMDFAREVGGRHPHVGIVLVAREPAPELLRAALQAGMRDVLPLPLSFEEVQSGLRAACAWSSTVRARLSHEGLDGSLSVGGEMIAVAGATVAVHLALDAARRARGRSVCLVDFDLQAGDVGLFLDLAHRRSVADLIDVAAEMSPRQIEDTVYRHSSGLRILLSPPEGEVAETVDTVTARRILGALKSYFDVVMVDVGTVVTEAGAVAVEMADEVLIVATPDVPALRAANRLLALWDRLQARDEDVRVVLNRVSKDQEVQPDLVRKVVDAPLMRTTLPAAFRALEPALNTGLPERLADGPLRKAIAALAREIEGTLQKDAAPRAGKSPEERLTRAEVGQVTAESVAVVPIIALIAVALWQMALVGLTFVFAGHAAREGARELAVGKEARPAVYEDLPGAWNDKVRIQEAEDWVEVSVAVPVLAPGLLSSPWSISARAGTVVEGTGP